MINYFTNLSIFDWNDSLQKKIFIFHLSKSGFTTKSFGAKGLIVCEVVESSDICLEDFRGP